MTKKQKVKAYRNAAELIRTGKTRAFSVSLGYYPKDVRETEFKELEVFYSAWYNCVGMPNDDMGGKEIILLSCAELVRLDFEIE